MRPINPNFIVCMSVYQPELDDRINMQHHMAMLHQLNNANVKVVELQGRYTYANGNVVNEPSFMLICPWQMRDGIVAKLKPLLADYNQESILIVEQDNTANLIMLASNATETIGTWRQVVAPHLGEDHSYDPKSNTYFVIR